MRRREFVALFGGAAAWPFTARSQQGSVPTIGFLNIGSREGWVPWLAAEPYIWLNMKLDDDPTKSAFTLGTTQPVLPGGAPVRTPDLKDLFLDVLPSETGCAVTPDVAAAASRSLRLVLPTSALALRAELCSWQI